MHLLESDLRNRNRESEVEKVERGFCGPKGSAPKGAEERNLAQDLPWVFGSMPEALKHSTRCRSLMPGGRPLTRRRGTYPEMPVAPSGLLSLGAFPRVNPGLISHGPLGRRPDPTHTQALGNVQNAATDWDPMLQ
jgi:hypothetical protein